MLLTGVGGATSFGQAAFVGIAAYATAWLTTAQGLSPWLGLLFALLLTGVVGAGDRHADAAPGRPLPAAVSTIAWGLSIAMLFGNVDALGRHTGISNIPALTLGSLVARRPARDLLPDLGAGRPGLPVQPQPAAVAPRPRDPQPARRRDRCSASVGADAYRVRLTLFVIAALLAGLAGWLYAHMNRFVSPSPFDVRASIEYLLMAVAGGLGQLARRAGRLGAGAGAEERACRTCCRC